MGNRNGKDDSSAPRPMPAADPFDAVPSDEQFDVDFEEVEDRPTAIPPDSFYDELVRKTTEAAKASSPSELPPQDDAPEIEIGAETELPVFETELTAPNDIPVDLGDFSLDPAPGQVDAPEEDDEQLPRSERPTTPRLEQDLVDDFPPLPDGGEPWPESRTAKSQPSKETLEALKRPSPSSERPTPIEPIDPVAALAAQPDQSHRTDENEKPSGSGEEDVSELMLALDSAVGGALALVSQQQEQSPDESSSPTSETPVSETPTKPQDDDRMTRLRDLYELGDYTGAHEVAEELLSEDPKNEEALRLRNACRDILVQMYTSRMGSVHRIPRVVVSPDDMRWLSLDHRAGFILSCVDGRSSIEDIMDVSGMSALETLRTLYQLMQQQVIEISDE